MRPGDPHLPRTRLAATSGTVLACALVAFPVITSALAGEPVAPTPSGDPVNGMALFEKRCTGCHALDRDREGPRLGKVFGRPAGTVAGYGYSDALRASHFTWNDDSLDKWLTDTDALIPGNNMDFRVPRADERADIIAFLRVQSGK